MINTRLVYEGQRQVIAIEKDGKTILLDRTHRCYVPDICNKFDAFASCVLPTANNLWDFSGSRVHVDAQTGWQLVYTSLPESYEMAAMYARELRLEGGEIVFDVGAYCGLSTLVFSRSVGPEGHVYAIEPDPKSFAVLQENLKTNDASNVTARQVAISDHIGFVPFVSEWNIGSGVAGIASTRESTGIIPCLRLQDVIPGTRIDALKIDAEGSEVAILSGALDWLRDTRPRVFIECHSYPSRNIEAKETVRTILESLSYHSHFIEPFGYESWCIVGEWAA